MNHRISLNRQTNNKTDTEPIRANTIITYLYTTINKDNNNNDNNNNKYNINKPTTAMASREQKCSSRSCIHFTPFSRLYYYPVLKYSLPVITENTLNLGMPTIQ